jgi:hypothetical protein
MNLLAKSCFAPGLISMISNLIASAGEPSGPPPHQGDWFTEYQMGMGHEIYRMKINYEDYGKDVPFSKVAEIAYSEF